MEIDQLTKKELLVKGRPGKVSSAALNVKYVNKPMYHNEGHLDILLTAAG